MSRAGFEVLAAIDFDAQAIETFRKNFPEVVQALKEDLTKYAPDSLARLLGTNRVDVVVGGPPCQGFSKVRRVDGSNSGKRMTPDSRRDLYLDFLRFVGYFSPRVFVMENVLGLRSAVGGEYFTAVQKEARALGYRVHPQVEDAWTLGVPQRRLRQLIVGVRLGLSNYFLPELKCPPRGEAHTCLWDAIGDLPVLRAGQGEAAGEYDLSRRERHLKARGESASRYLDKVLEIDRAKLLTNHDARTHSERDLRDFSRLHEGETSAKAMRVRKVRFEFPYKKDQFKDRYTKQSRWRPCSTIVAHLSRDGLMFIHPTQNRSLTAREAARVQSFPDWFQFPKPRTNAYRLIGNAVPPLVAEAVGIAVREFLNLDLGTKTDPSVHPEKHGGEPALYRGGQSAASSALRRMANMDRSGLRALSIEELVAGWRALLYLFPDLHPDNARDHGKSVEYIRRGGLVLVDDEVFSHRYARSGWPVVLEPLGNEIWRRYEKGELNETDVYCTEAQLISKQG
jgi:DNA (cytosine-5)-methyltransferase 1